MKLIQIAVYGVAACVMIAPAALAQSLVPNGQNGPAVQPKAPIPDIAAGSRGRAGDRHRAEGD
jgi:negative regulator of sigma E activity